MLLTEKQQLFLINLLEKSLTEKTQCVYNDRWFRRYIEPLKEKDLIKEKETNNGSIFSLTLKGNIVARFLAGLLDGDEKERFDKYAIV